MFLMVLFLALLVEIGQWVFSVCFDEKLYIASDHFANFFDVHSEPNFFPPSLIVSAYNTFYLCKHALKNEFNILRSLQKHCELALITENKHDDIGCLFRIYSVVCFRRVLEVWCIYLFQIVFISVFIRSCPA